MTPRLNTSDRGSVLRLIGSDNPFAVARALATLMDDGVFDPSYARAVSHLSSSKEVVGLGTRLSSVVDAYLALSGVRAYSGDDEQTRILIHEFGRGRKA